MFYNKKVIFLYTKFILLIFILYKSINNWLVNENVKNVWISVIGSTFVGLSWKIHCNEKTGLVVGYHIYYCPVITDISNPLCRGKTFLFFDENLILLTLSISLWHLILFTSNINIVHTIMQQECMVISTYKILQN